MRIIAIVFGGLLGLAMLAVIWAIRLLGLIMAFATAAMLLLALTQIDHPHMWIALHYALLCFVVVLACSLPLVLSEHVPASKTSVRAPQRNVALAQRSIAHRRSWLRALLAAR